MGLAAFIVRKESDNINKIEARRIFIYNLFKTLEMLNVENRMNNA